MSRALHLAPVGQADRPPAGDVVADLANGPDGVLEGQVPQTVDGSSSMRSTMLVAPTLRKVAYSLMLESPTITWRRRYFSASAWGSSRVLMIGRLRVVAERHALPDVFGPLAEAEDRPPGRLEHLARPGVGLSADQERDEHLGVVGEVVPAAGQVVLVATVGVARRVGVVLEQVDVPPDALLPESGLGPLHQMTRGSTPPPCRGSPARRCRRTQAWRTRDGCPRRGRAGHRSRGRRWTTGPS